MLNKEIAERLEEVAQLLNQQKANRYRIEAYRKAAATLRSLSRSVSEILATGGVAGLEELPAVGKTLARFIAQMIHTGKLPILERLRGSADPVRILTTVPGIGRKLAEKIHHDLGIESLEELETAAHDGRLAQIEGFGHKKLAGIRDSLAARLQVVRTRFEPAAAEQVPIDEILHVDREYRLKSSKQMLPKIAPRRFNPSRERWLPILHTERESRRYTALFSNTARAHDLQKTHDWVVIYFETDNAEGQYTVITAQSGKLKGKRIVRGREKECEQYYSARVRKPHPGKQVSLFSSQMEADDRNNSNE